MIWRRKKKEKRGNIAAMQESLSSPPQPASEVASSLPGTSTQGTIFKSSVTSMLKNGAQSVYVPTPEGQPQKYRKIVDFVPKSARKSEEEVDLGNGVKLKLNTASKLKVEQVTHPNILLQMQKY